MFNAFVSGNGVRTRSDAVGERGANRSVRARASLLRAAAVEALETRRLMAIFNVVNTNDAGAGSLRQAITSANLTAAADTINFAIPGTGVKTIQPATALPDVTQPLTIDGYTQAGSSANTLALAAGDNAQLRIELDARNVSNGLKITASNVTVKGLVVNRATFAGILIEDGTNVSILGNFIGTDATGTADLGNTFAGVVADTTLARIGGPAPADRNVISGNGDATSGVGIVLGGNPSEGIPFNTGDGTLIRGNYVGTTASGTVALPNRTGINWYSTIDVTVGGPAAADGNVISGNTGAGIGSFSGGNINLLVRNNLIGTDRTGTADLGNGGNAFQTDGVQLQDGLTFRDNVIAGNGGAAIVLSIDSRQASGITVADNFIGTDRSATLDLGNGGGLSFGGNDNTIRNNVIAHNGSGVGIVFFDPTTGGGFGEVHGLRNRITQNRIFDNTGEAIDIGAGINDALDADTNGANRLQNFPIITSAVGDATATAIAGTLNSTPNHAFHIELFRTSAILGVAREADAYLGAVDVTTDGAGNASFHFVAAGGLAANSAITATATDATAGSPLNGNTSEISDPRIVTAGTPAAAAVYLSDLTPTFAVNGFGPYERDRSNGEAGVGDGRAITLNGATYTKGLGVHGASELRYRLDRAYTHFLTTIGVDDEVGNAGKVVFRVVADGITLYESPALTGASASIPLDLNVTGRNELRLIVTTSDNGPAFDHADWADARLTPMPAPVFISNLVPASAVNGFGAFENDRSNGESGPHDGHALTLNGTAYTKGIGVHAASDVRYNLNGKYQSFEAKVGVDDEVGAFGSVVFQVWGDGTLLYDSGVMTGGSATKSISVGVAGRNQLWLVVTNAGNGNAYDHADWADAKLLVAPPITPSTFLSDVAPINAVNGFGPFENDHSNGGLGAADGHAITLNGVAYSKGLGTHANSTLRYKLAGRYTQFFADVGIDDEVGTGGRVVFRVLGDGVLLFDSGVMTGATATKQARVNVAGRNELVLEVFDAGDGINNDHADWAAARVE